ncbi:AbrB/MazE/SpoVT family DNA-binding domain-containing protein [Fictibacillus nanhaiensis]|uniref:AbrB/MazE/SpoVT family DNA-binding domain-containing protein n=1 Tax=Fictibacillus nanhaiensis TaxID=742169 RepID=UPI00203F3701|nr:AbrB/MazE/SpoVT family DNA-binding domain-containing protein [Fictibacillus nanhaiensis]MCM3732988.1 AbrB/MazE/SpoVT family DNA-binding domain-containing protein [Fictibacillus nanhaiensis]
MSVTMMQPIERKITKIGNSLGVTIPLEALKEANVQLGDSVIINVQDGDIVVRKNTTVTLPKGINPKFAEAMSRTLNRYEETLRALKDR